MDTPSGCFRFRVGTGCFHGAEKKHESENSFSGREAGVGAPRLWSWFLLKQINPNLSFPVAMADEETKSMSCSFLDNKQHTHLSSRWHFRPYPPQHNSNRNLIPWVLVASSFFFFIFSCPHQSFSSPLSFSPLIHRTRVVC